MILSFDALVELVKSNVLSLEEVAYFYGEETADQLLTRLLPDPFDQVFGG